MKNISKCHIRNMKTCIENLNFSNAKFIQHRVKNVTIDMELSIIGDDKIPMNEIDCWNFIIDDYLKNNLGLTYKELLQEYFPEKLI